VFDLAKPGHQPFHWSFRDGCKPRKRCLTEDVADQKYIAKEEKQYKSPFSFDFIFYPNLCDLS
jgi:hypothetical protein